MKLLVFFVALFLAVSCFAYELKLTIPDDKVSLVVDSFCKAYKYQPTIQDAEGKDIPNPETKVGFTKKCIAGYIKEVVRAVKAQEAGEAARQAALNSPDSNVEIQ